MTRPPRTLGALLALAVVLTSGCTTGTSTGQGGDVTTSERGRAGERSPVQEGDLDEELRQAAWSGDAKAAAALVARGADVDAKDSTQQSAYLIAASEGHVDLLDLALRSGATVDDKDSWNGTALIRAAERGHARVVGRLLQAGIDRDHVNRIGYQAVHEAVLFGKDTAEYVDTVRALVAGGVELDRSSETERLTPLEMARDRGYDALQAALRGAAPPGGATGARAALLSAAESGDADAVAWALRSGAGIESRDEGGRTALALAATYDRVDVARLLVLLGADVNSLDEQHDTPWLITGVTGSVRMLETLLPGRPDLRIVNRFGGTALIPASERGHVEYVRRAVTTGIDLDHVNRLGWTALLEAVVLGDGGPRHQQVVRILLDAGADPSIADSGGVTALEHARQRGYDELVTLLSAAR